MKYDNVVLRTPSPVDAFIYEEGIDASGNKVTFVQNDLYMLFNQERLQKLGMDTVQKWIDSLQPSANSGLDELRAKLSDDELLSIIKSRHIQSPSELLAYSRWLSASADRLTELQKELASESVSEPVVESKTE